MRPEQRSGCRPKEAPRTEAQEGLFWELAPEDVIAKLAQLSCARIKHFWKRRKDKIEEASSRSWTENKKSPRTMQLREYTLREFWEIFVDDRPFGADASVRHVNVQSKAVFSHAMTIMDEIYGWEDDEKRVGSKFAACMWIYTKKNIDKGQIPNPALEE